MEIKFSDGTSKVCTSCNEQTVVHEGKILRWLATVVVKDVDSAELERLFNDGILLNPFSVYGDADETTEPILQISGYTDVSGAFVRCRNDGVYTEIQLTKTVEEVE